MILLLVNDEGDIVTRTQVNDADLHLVVTDNDGNVVTELD